MHFTSIDKKVRNGYVCIVKQKKKMEKIRQVISKSVGRKQCPKGGSNLEFMEQVVYKTPMGKIGGRVKFSSVTRHEIVREKK